MSGLRAFSYEHSEVNSTTRPNSLSVHPDIFDEGDPHSQDQNCLALVRAVLGRAILDATGALLPRDRKNQDKIRAQIYFRRRGPLPFEWGWIIDALEFSEAQAQRIEAVCIPERSWTTRPRSPQTVLGILDLVRRRTSRD